MHQHSLKSIVSAVLLCVATSVVPVSHLSAQPAVSSPSSTAPAQATLPPPISTVGVLPQSEMDRRIAAHGLYVTEMEIRDLLLKVEGYDSARRKVKLTLDRRNGDLLAREIKLGKERY
ncbi:hypothetical protein [Polaromonas jejuensis]|uniref:POTRA domain-containing protein n=1 Tax=Polaromonas jejuensis TaxID=457502 RepID=A0ABW0Q923_9BURK|nr:hypothetical protein [Polaromonas jejuensis]